LSLRLAALTRALDTARLTPASGYQWLDTERIPGISLPWAVWLKIVPGSPTGPVIVAVESAYLAASPPKGGQPEAFRFIVEQTRRLDKPYGMPPRRASNRPDTGVPSTTSIRTVALPPYSCFLHCR